MYHKEIEKAMKSMGSNSSRVTLKSIYELVKTLVTDVNDLKVRVGKIEVRLDNIDTRLDNIDARLDYNKLKPLPSKHSK